MGTAQAVPGPPGRGGGTAPAAVAWPFHAPADLPEDPARTVRGPDPLEAGRRSRGTTMTATTVTTVTTAASQPHPGPRVPVEHGVPRHVELRAAPRPPTIVVRELGP